MMDWAAYLWSGTSLFLLAIIFWLLSLKRNDVSIVDSLWSLMFLVAALVYAGITTTGGVREFLVLILVGIWSIRLTTYITLRNHGHTEDYRYKEIRANNQPGFRYKSFYLVFVFQALMAWVICLPLVAAISGQTALGILDYAGLAMWVTGMLFEAIGDLQLSRFKAVPENAGKVLNTGLWRYSRHPNYFGNFLIWWGFYLVALSAGGWWSIISPLLMTFLLLKVSGVALLEKDISKRRPEYAEYIRHTNAFFPGPPRT